MACFTRILGSETVELEAGLVWRVHALEPDACLGKMRDWDRAGQRTQLAKQEILGGTTDEKGPSSRRSNRNWKGAGGEACQHSE